MIIQPKALIEQVKERINEHGNPQKITELCLDEIAISSFTPDIIAVVENCKNVEHLSVASCSLISLLNFPKLTKLRYLDLQQNAFSDTNLNELQNQYETFSGINISKNNINNLETIIQCVNKLTIKEINIFETPVFESNPKIIEVLFQNCKTLQCINWEDRRGKEVKEFQAESFENSSDGLSENNGKNYSVENQQISEEMDEEMSMQSSKRVKVQ